MPVRQVPSATRHTCRTARSTAPAWCGSSVGSGWLLSPARTWGQRSHVATQSRSGSLWRTIPRQRRGSSSRLSARPPRLFHFGTVDSGRFLAVILADRHGLVRIKRPASAIAVRLRYDVDHVARRISGHGELVPALGTGSQGAIDQVGGCRPRRAAGGRPHFRQRGGIPTVLRVVLHLHGVDGPYRSEEHTSELQ